MTTVQRTAEIAATPAALIDIMLNVADHHTWQREIERIDLLETDAGGRPALAKVHVSAMGQKASYTVRYAYTSPTSFEYHLVEGDLMTSSDFTFSADPVGVDSSRVTVSQALTVSWPLPGFMVDQLTLKGVKDMLKALAARAEAAATSSS
ncbi:SRPBCC family protein [Janibacter sp. HTCC2649]|uniref:SRPBCC family protein n=1 Tax=Janibacter sp. HTCC2649 TaxID=313589 RepID=UPI0003040E90|nr:SRPBCC family protein [Janibacter sp. HTCC2649]